MDSCVEQVLANPKFKPLKGKTRKQSAIAICYDQIMGKGEEVKMDKISFYLPFTKKDDDKRLVEGFASTETEDSQGEIVKSEALANALPDYMKYANIREMHQWSAVGKTIAAKLDTMKKGLWIRGKIVDDQAWRKVKEKVYNGFSIGGKVLKKVGNIVQELILNEISLVDRPANPQAVFSLVKIEGDKVIEKQLPIAPTGLGMADEAFPGIKMADKLIAVAANLIFLLDECDRLNRPKKHIEKVIQQLKRAALTELQAEKVAMTKKLVKTSQNYIKEASGLESLLEEIRLSKAFDPKWSVDYFDELRKML